MFLEVTGLWGTLGTEGQSLPPSLPRVVPLCPRSGVSRLRRHHSIGQWLVSSSNGPGLHSGLQLLGITTSQGSDSMASKSHTKLLSGPE